MTRIRQASSAEPAVQRTSELGRTGPALTYAFDEFSLDVQARVLTRLGAPVSLGARAVQLLIALVEHRDRVVGKRELMKIAWPRSIVVENSLAVAICALRQAFEGRFYIRNEYGKGYRFVAPVTPGRGPAAAGIPAWAEQPGIAVLPFAGPAGDDGAFGQGVAEDIIAALSRNRWLRVIARNSSFSYSPDAAGVGEIARQLGVRYVLGGGIRRAGQRVRVVAHLDDAVSATHLVSERYDGVMADIFAVQDDIAARIANSVRPVLLEAEQVRSFRTQPDSVDAWLACQRGNWFLNQQTAEDMRAAIAWFRRAIALDDRYAPGYYGLARLLCRAGSGHNDATPDDWQDQAEQLALQAIRLDPRDPIAHATFGWSRYVRGDHSGAIAAAQAALELNPSDAGAFATLGAALVFSGRPAEGIDALHSGIDLDPRDPRVPIRQMQVGLGLYFMGDHAAVEDHAASMMRAWPSYSGSARLMAMAMAETGRYTECLAHLEHAIALWAPPFDNFSHARMPWYRAEDFRRVLDGFRRAGWRGPGD